MTSPAPVEPSGAFVKNEPVVAAHIAAWLVLNAGVLLVSRYHVFTSEQWSVGAIELTGMVTAGLLALMGGLQRRLVSPAWKLAAAKAAAPVVVEAAPLEPVVVDPVVADASDAHAAFTAAALLSNPGGVQPVSPDPYMGGGKAADAPADASTVVA